MSGKEALNMLDERRYILENIIKNTDARILEIGPLNYPVVKKDTYKNCFYCDIRSTEEVKALYSGNEYLESTGIKVDLDSIVEIDYVLKDSYKETFKDVEKFDFVVASHVLEHIEDIIGFLNDIVTVMKPKGKLCILYPDKRYCFDHFRESASFRDAYDVYRRGNQETARMTLDFFNNCIEENNAQFFWCAEDLSTLMPLNDTAKAINSYEMVLQGKKLDDVHFWPFTDRGFIKFLYDCTRANLLPFSCVDFHPTQENTQQFLIILEYQPQVIENKSNELKNLINIFDKTPLDYHNSKHLHYEQSNNLILNKLNTELNNFNNSLQNHYEKLIKAYCEIEEKISKLINDVKILTEENNSLRANIIELKGFESQLLAEIDYLRTIENSTLWRMTKPLRIILDFIKNLLKKK